MCHRYQKTVVKRPVVAKRLINKVKEIAEKLSNYIWCLLAVQESQKSSKIACEVFDSVDQVIGYDADDDDFVVGGDLSN